MSKAIKEFADFSQEQLIEVLEKQYREHYVLRQKQVLGGLSQTHLLREKRRNIARLKTLLQKY